MKTFHVEQSLPPRQKTTVIEASAGTGKTWMIAALAVRYVAEGKATIDQILVVTFTRLATSELKDRIRSRFVEVHRTLTTIAADLAGGNQPEPTGDQLINALVHGIDSDELAERINRLAEALTHFDAATIATIHGFCQSVLTGLGITQQVAPLENLTSQLSALSSEITHDVFLSKFAAEPNQGLSWDQARNVVNKLIDEPSTRLREPEPSTAQSDRSLDDQAYEFAQAARAEFIQRTTDRSITTYAHFLELLKDAVGKGETAAAAYLRHRWPVVLVDEFQDTDPTQWQIFKNSFHRHSALILIGDPKQAIYGFRGADIHTYHQAVAEADDQFTLATNFRSTPKLVASFNEIWTGAKLGEEIQAGSVTPAQHTQQNDVYFPDAQSVLPPFQMRLPGGENLAQALTLKADDFRRVIIADLTYFIQDTIRQGSWQVESNPPGGSPYGSPDSHSGSHSGNHAVRPEDFAVLCASNDQCALVARALRKAGIPVSYSAGTIDQTDAAHDLRALLSAFIDPSQQSLIHQVAISPFFGCDTQDLLHEETGDRVADQIGQWSELFTAFGLEAVIEAASAQGLAAAAITMREGDRYLTDLRHLAELAREAGFMAPFSAEQLLAWLDGELADEGVERIPDNDGSAVRVLTIHSSKGLQFPIVLLPFSPFGGKSRSAPFYFHDEHSNQRLIAATPVGDSKEQAVAQDHQERLRTWYVATTRAQNHVISWCVPYWANRPHPAQQLILLNRKPGDEEANFTIKRNDWNGVLNALAEWEHITTAPMKWAFVGPKPLALSSAPDVPEPKITARPFTRTVDHSWRRTSYSGLSAEAERRRAWTHRQRASTPILNVDTRLDPQEAHTPENLADAATPPTAGESPKGTSWETDPGAAALSPMAHLPLGNRFGSLVHDILEQLDPGQPEFANQIPELVHHGLQRWPVTMDQDQIRQLCAAIEAVCTTPLGPLFDGATLADLGAANRLPELPFDIPLAGGYGASAEYGKPRTLTDIAGLLRKHLPPEDPLYSYAQELEDDAYAATVLHGYLTGSIDAVLRTGDSYVVVDYKTNWLGKVDEPLTLGHYGPQQLQQAMVGSSYPLQALLYAVAAHRFLRWRIADYDPDIHLGGVAYLYLRGMGGPNSPVTNGHVHGVFSWKPPTELVAELSDLLDAHDANTVHNTNLVNGANSANALHSTNTVNENRNEAGK